MRTVSAVAELFVLVSRIEVNNSMIFGKGLTLCCRTASLAVMFLISVLVQ